MTETQLTVEWAGARHTFRAATVEEAEAFEAACTYRIVTDRQGGQRVEAQVTAGYAALYDALIVEVAGYGIHGAARRDMSEIATDEGVFSWAALIAALPIEDKVVAAARLLDVETEVTTRRSLIAPRIEVTARILGAARRLEFRAPKQADLDAYAGCTWTTRRPARRGADAVTEVHASAAKLCALYDALFVAGDRVEDANHRRRIVQAIFNRVDDEAGE